MSVCVVLLWYTYAVPAVDANANKTALVSYKAEVRAKSMAVSKAEIVLNEVCAAMASRLGRVDGVTISPNKGRILLEVRADTTVRVHFFFLSPNLSCVPFVAKCGREGRCSRCGRSGNGSSSTSTAKVMLLPSSSVIIECRIPSASGGAKQACWRLILLCSTGWCGTIAICCAHRHCSLNPGFPAVNISNGSQIQTGQNAERNNGHRAHQQLAATA